jgi:hypothetical protein
MLAYAGECSRRLSIARGMSAVTNRADKLLQACRNPLINRLLASSGFPTPQELERGDGRFRAPMIAGYGVRCIALRGASPLERQIASLSMVPPSYPTPTKRPQRIVFDMSGVTANDFTEFATMRVKPVISSLTPNSRLLFVTTITKPQALGSEVASVAAGVNSFVRSLAKRLAGEGPL